MSTKSNIWLLESVKKQIHNEEEEKLKESLKVTKALMTALIIGAVAWAIVLITCLILFPIQTIKVCFAFAVVLFIFVFCTT